MAPSFPASRPSGWRCALPVRAARRPRARLHGPDQRRGVRGRRPARPSRTRSTTRSGSTASSRSTRTTCAARRARARSRSTPRTSRSGSSTRSRPIPGDDLVLNLDIDVQAAGRAGAPVRAGDRQGPAVQRTATVPPKAEVGLHGRARPEHGRRARHGVVPDLRPRASSSTASATPSGQLPHRRGEQRPAQQLGHPGPVRARVHLQALQRGVGPRGGADHARHHRVRRRRVRGARLHAATRARSATTSEKQYGVVDLRRSLTVSSDFYYYGLGARFWIEQDRLGGPERVRRPPEAVGVRRRHGHRPVQRAVRPDPVADLAGRLLRVRRLCRGLGQLAHRQQRQHGDRAGRRAPHAAPARVGLRHHRQRRHRVAAPRREGGARRRHQGAEAQPSSPRSWPPSSSRPSGARPSTTASPASPPRPAAPRSAPSAASPPTRSRSRPRRARPRSPARRPPRCSAPSVPPTTPSTRSPSCSRSRATAVRWRPRSRAGCSTCCVIPPCSRPRPRAGASSSWTRLSPTVDQDVRD